MRKRTDSKRQATGESAGADAVWYGKLLISLYLATFLIRASFGVLLTTFPRYAGITDNLVFGVLSAVAPATELVTVLALGAYIDRHGRRGMLLAGLIAGALANLLIALTPNKFLIGLGLTQILHGFSSGAILVSSLALLADYAPAGHRGREIGLFDGVNLAGWATGFLVGGLALDAFGLDPNNLRWIFVISAALAGVGWLYAHFNLHEPKREAVTVAQFSVSQITDVLKQKTILILIMPWIVIYMLIGTVLAFGAKSGEQSFKLPGWQIGVILFGGTLAILAFQRGYGVLSDRIGRVKVMAIGTLGIIGVMSALAAAYFLTPDVERHPERLLATLLGNKALLGTLGLSVLLSGAFAPAALASLADEAPVKGRGVTMGLYSVVVSLGQILGPIGFGAISNAFGGLGAIAFLILLGILMGMALLVRWLQTRQAGGPRAKQGGEVDDRPPPYGVGDAEE